MPETAEPDPLESVDEFDDEELYRYEHGTEKKHCFRVNLDYADSENFADYGEGAIQFQYRDGYVADLPRSKVEAQIADGKIVPLEARLKRKYYRR